MSHDFFVKNARFADLNPTLVSIAGYSEDLLVIILSLGGIAGLFGGSRGAHISRRTHWSSSWLSPKTMMRASAALLKAKRTSRLKAFMWASALMAVYIRGK
jgi:predicted MFS family arabinose efflux permease